MVLLNNLWSLKLANSRRIFVMVWASRLVFSSNVLMVSFLISFFFLFFNLRLLAGLW